MDGNTLILTQYLENFTYIGLFFILFLCGLGLPIPEEITLVIGGYLSYQGITHYLQTVLVCLTGVMAGDLTLYFIGSYWGAGIINHHRFSWIFTERRLSKAQKYLKKYGKRTIFLARFLSGIRSGVYLTAGSLRMNVFDFAIMDFLAALFGVPLLVYIGYGFGEHIENTFFFVNRGSHIILAFVVAAALYIIYYLYKTNQETKEID